MIHSFRFSVLLEGWWGGGGGGRSSKDSFGDSFQYNCNMNSEVKQIGCHRLLETLYSSGAFPRLLQDNIQMETCFLVFVRQRLKIVKRFFRLIESSLPVSCNKVDNSLKHFSKNGPKGTQQFWFCSIVDQFVFNKDEISLFDISALLYIIEQHQTYQQD